MKNPKKQIYSSQAHKGKSLTIFYEVVLNYVDCGIPMGTQLSHDTPIGALEGQASG